MVADIVVDIVAAMEADIVVVMGDIMAGGMVDMADIVGGTTVDGGILGL